MLFNNTFTQRGKQFVHFIILSQCTADHTLYLLSEFGRATRNRAFILPGAVCKFIICFSFPCFADLLFPPLFSFLFFLWGYFYISWSFLFRYCLFLIAPVASLLLLVAVMIWFSHFPICCNNFILSHLKEAYRQTPRLMCEQKMRREMMHYSHRLIQALCTNQHFKSNRMEMGLRGSWVRYKPRREEMQTGRV